MVKARAAASIAFQSDEERRRTAEAVSEREESVVAAAVSVGQVGAEQLGGLDRAAARRPPWVLGIPDTTQT